MDALFWKAGWKPSDDEEFFAKLRTALDGPRWVLDGNYSRTTPIKWARADTVIWLDLSFARTLHQAFWRSLRRSLTKEELWPETGNRESLRRTFASGDSILLWMMISHRRVRRRYEETMRDPRYAHIRFVRLRTHADADRFLETLSTRNSLAK